MKALIVGCGQMGKAIAYAMGRLGYDLILHDPSVDALRKAKESLKILAIKTNVQSKHYLSGAIDLKPDVVVSAATYSANVNIAHSAFYAGIPYCDLGGDTETSHSIKQKATAFGVECFTDLGLAPGLINIVAENLVVKNPDSKNLVMRVGGLPQLPHRNSLNYSLTWSPEGLYNEYTGKCKIWKDYQEIEVDALSEYDEFKFMDSDWYESFCTKGAMAHSLETFKYYRLRNALYKTIRYSGHCDYIDFMLNECKMDEETFKKCIINTCGTTKQDIVLMQVQLEGKEKWATQIPCDNTWTAMQKATAFPAAAIASLMATKELEPNVVHKYLDIPLNGFNEELEKIGGLPCLNV